MSYEWVEHTSELELRVEAPSEELVFQDTMKALAELLNEGGAGPEVTRQIQLEAPDRAALLVAWLEELLFLAETEGLVPTEVELVRRNTHLEATVHGRIGEPRPLVKGITYHGLEVEKVAGSWRAQVVIDV